MRAVERVRELGALEGPTTTRVRPRLARRLHYPMVRRMQRAIDRRSRGIRPLGHYAASTALMRNVRGLARASEQVDW